MKYKIYYNEDCAKYGVQAYKRNINYKGDPARWTQILIYKGREVAPFQVDGRKAHAYTRYEAVAKRWLRELEAKQRLEQLRKELRAERISYSELAELESLKQYIDAGDVELLEAAGVPENATL